MNLSPGRACLLCWLTILWVGWGDIIRVQMEVSGVGVHREEPLNLCLPLHV